MEKLIISPAPHIHSGDSVSKNMYGVVIAMVPTLLASLYFFGLGALIVTLIAVAASVLFEFLIQKYILKSQVSILDGSAAVTGLLLAFNLPTNLPIWMIIIGALVAIGVAKMSFGGLGNNPFNPALVGRVFLLISFPVEMTTWPVADPFATTYLDAETGATVLSILKEGQATLPEIYEMVFGNIIHSVGLVTSFAMLLGLAYMLWKKIITWHIPVSILATVAVFTGILHLVDPQTYTSPFIHLFSGGLMLGAIFMATDYVTSPMTFRGMWIYGVGIGILTVVIRNWGAYPEGVAFAILIMNGFTPIINFYVKPKRFGEKPIKA